MRKLGDRFMFQHDNDPRHTLKLCREKLERVEPKRQISIIKWPPQGPDINPIKLYSVESA